VELSVFEAVGALLPGMIPDGLGDVRQYAHRYGIKVWFDTEKPTREHYEAQVVGAKEVAGAKVLAIEVGFHAENTKEADNETALAKLMSAEKKWRKVVGPEAVGGVFLGRAEHWRRISETWPDPDLDDPDLPFEIAARLTDYISALEPLRRK
jgi:hypothetical protein